MVWLHIPASPGGSLSAALLDCYALSDDPHKQYERIAGLLDTGLPLAAVFAEASHELRYDFHNRGGTQGDSGKREHESCYLAAMAWDPADSHAGSLHPAIAHDFANDLARERRMLIALVHRDCPRAPCCLDYMLQEADLRVRQPDEYGDLRRFKREATAVGHRIIEACETDPVSAAHRLRGHYGVAVYIEPF